VGLAIKRTVGAIAGKKVKTIDGNDIPMIADCVCVHSDTPGAMAVAKAVGDEIAAYLN
jgi:5-oxoprolinase (ATP-hydrolysing) subunit A